VQPARGTNARFTYPGDGPAGTSDQLFELAATADADSHDARAAAARSRDLQGCLSLGAATHIYSRRYSSGQRLTGGYFSVSRAVELRSPDAGHDTSS